MHDYIDTSADRCEIKVVKNLPKFIYVSSDTIHRHVRHFESVTLRKGRFIGAMSTSITLGIPLMTSEFKDFAGITGATWQGIFILAFVASLGVIAYNGFRFYSHPETVESVIKKIEGTQETSNKAVKQATLEPF